MPADPNLAAIARALDVDGTQALVDLEERVRRSGLSTALISRGVGAPPADCTTPLWVDTAAKRLYVVGVGYASLT